MLPGHVEFEMPLYRRGVMLCVWAGISGVRVLEAVYWMCRVDVVWVAHQSCERLMLVVQIVQRALEVPMPRLDALPVVNKPRLACHTTLTLPIDLRVYKVHNTS